MAAAEAPRARAPSSPQIRDEAPRARAPSSPQIRDEAEVRAPQHPVAAPTPPPAVAASTPEAPPARDRPEERPGAVAPLQQALIELQQRVEELERHPQAATPEVRQRLDELKQRALAVPAAAGVPPPAPVVHAAPIPTAAPTPLMHPAPVPQMYAAQVSATPTRPGLVPLTPTPPPAALAPVQGVSQGFRELPIAGGADVSFEMDPALDGRARRRRIVWRFLLFLVLVFGGLLAAVAYSYTPQAKFLSP